MELLYSSHFRKLANLKPTFRRNFIDEVDWSEQLVGIKGARGVGKTTLLLQHIKETYGNSRECLYVSLDDVTFSYNNIVELAADFWAKGGKAIYFDEVHKYNNWSQELKNIYDSYPGLKVVFTSSSLLHIHSGSADLSRRAVVYQMYGLSFREFLEIETAIKFEKYTLQQLTNGHTDIAAGLIAQIKPLAWFANYLRYGYYPYYLQNKRNFSAKLASAISLTLEVDLPWLMNVDVRHLNKLKRLLYILANNVPFKPNISKLAESLDLSRNTVSLYLSYLQEAEIIRMLYATGKGYNTLTKPEKVYLWHPNLNFTLAQENTDPGNMREAFFASQLGVAATIEAPVQGDFLVNSKYTFEVGGKNKTTEQLKNIPDSYVAADDIEIGFDRKIPLWMFGFLY
jgi:predicted AAA+ superfamily ATPase